VIVCVKDTGIGLSQPDIDQLFQKFFRVEGVSKVFTGGSGLGLFVARKVVDLHKGELAVWSRGRGKGTTFCFAVGAAKSGR
jgi:signal transduction histidine kinase